MTNEELIKKAEGMLSGASFQIEVCGDKKQRAAEGEGKQGELFARGGFRFARPAGPAKLDRSRWKGCYSCENMLKTIRMVKLGRNYCPRCGRPLTEEAWAELERRIGGNDGTTDN